MKILLLGQFIIFSCDNPIFNIYEKNQPTEPSCTETVDCVGVCGGVSVEDVCGVCDGDGSTCEAVARMWTIYYDTSSPIGGFQFNVADVIVNSASGGAAAENGFMISANATTVLGFSLSGVTVPIGVGVLVVLEVIDSGDACILIDGLIISSANGTALPASVKNCNTIQIP